jgi:hypothetical protein
MAATLTGIPLYRAHGYKEIAPIDVALPNGGTLPVVRMGKSLVSGDAGGRTAGSSASGSPTSG